MEFALIKDGTVENVIVCDEQLDLPGYDDVVRVDNLDTKPGPGWTYAGEIFAPLVSAAPPVVLGVLTHDKWAIAADDVEIVTLTYTADEAVCFVVNDEINVVEPVDSVATLEISADAVGPIRVEVRGQRLVLAATEVAA